MVTPLNGRFGTRLSLSEIESLIRTAVERGPQMAACSVVS
jgi:hypothetical protein